MSKSVKQAVAPLVVGLKQLFMKPYTIKYPYEIPPTLPSENYRYDPKAGIAYPGYKGRHVLHMDKCTGCSLCDIACSYVSEAITMVYAFDVKLVFDERVYNGLKSADRSIVSPIEGILLSIQEANKEVYAKRGASHPLVIMNTDVKQIAKSGEMYEMRLNADHVWEHRSDLLVDKYLSGAFSLLESEGWSVKLVEDKSPDYELYRFEKGDIHIDLVVQKVDFKRPQNKKSYFPQVDYGRCVFCGFCVDACPFYALEMSPDVELSSLEREGLVYNPVALASKKVSTVQPTVNPIDAIYSWLKNHLRWE